MTIGIRCDANDTIAMGHLMRCITIAEQLREMGQDILFFLSDASSVSVLEERKFAYRCLYNDYRKKEQELPSLLSYCRQVEISFLLVDSYEVTTLYLSELRKYFPVAYIDDINICYYPVDLLINYTIDAAVENYAKMGDYGHTRFLLGNRYIPVRKEFLVNRRSDISYPPQGVFLTSGGTDSYGIVLKILQEMHNVPSMKLMTKYVVVGKYYNQWTQLQEIAVRHGNVQIYQDVSDIWNVMKKADVAVSAGGTTIAELCALGLPTVGFCIADNQMPGLAGYNRMHAIDYVGDVRTDETNVLRKISAEIERMTRDRQFYELLAENAKENVDGKGAYRIAQELVSLVAKK